MKTPDKIYMTPSYGEPDNVLLASFSKSHLDYHRDIEYIRKDALIELLENVAAEYKKRSDEGELVWQNMCGISEAISIINEM